MNTYRLKQRQMLKGKILTGVHSQNSANWLWTEDYIDLAYVEHEDECSRADHSGCLVGEGIKLYGDWLRSGFSYRPDPDGLFSAIVRPRRPTVQVVKSQFVISCSKASPCYPGQGDEDTPGPLKAYCLPPDLMADRWLEENARRISKAKGDK